MGTCFNRKQTILKDPLWGDDGVIRYRMEDGTPIVLVYIAAQQAIWGNKLKERYSAGLTFYPYAEFVDIELLPSPVNDETAKAAASWIKENGTESLNGGLVWLNDFDFIFLEGYIPVPGPWLCGIGQANVLMACLYWHKHTKEEIWEKLAHRAVIPFTKKVSTKDGIYYDFGNGKKWYEEYPTINPSHILNCHLLSLLALEKTWKQLNDENAKNSFYEGFKALEEMIPLFDRKIWSRYDLSDNFNLFIRFLPSKTGRIVLGKIELFTKEGFNIAKLDAVKDLPCDHPISRLAGGNWEWGEISEIHGKKGRIIKNYQDFYENNIPQGGTDQNTYIIFQENLPFRYWGHGGLILRINVFLDENSSLKLEFRDPRISDLAFFSDESKFVLSGNGWKESEINIPPEFLGWPLGRHYHRLHAEYLGLLSEKRESSIIYQTFEKWHRADLFEYNIKNSSLPEFPQNIFLFVNNKCGLQCKMCDWGTRNMEASLSRNMTQKGSDLDIEVLKNAMEKDKSCFKNSEFSITGTEPLMYKNICQLIKVIKSYGSRVGITSNGLFLEEKASELADLEMDFLFLSIDGPCEIHDEIRGNKGLFHKIIKGVSLLKSECKKKRKRIPDINVSFTISQINHNKIMEFMESIRNLEPNSVLLSHLNYVSPEIADYHNRQNNIYKIYPSSAKVWESCMDMDFWSLYWELEEARKIDWTEVHIIPYCSTPNRLKWYYTKPFLPMSRTQCNAPFSSMQILADSSVTVMGRCYNVVMGNLKNESIYKIWHGENYRKFRDFLKSNNNLPACYRCCGSL